MTSLNKVIEELEAADRLRTKGPWYRDETKYEQLVVCNDCPIAVMDSSQKVTNAEFICLAANHLPKLLQAVKKYQSLIKEYQDFTQDCLARANQAIDTDCPQCDYQCEGCIRGIDDAEYMKRRSKETLNEVEGMFK